MIDSAKQSLARKTALNQAAGNEPMNYLRSMFQVEFFASIANEWFAGSFNTFSLGFTRFDRGYYELLNQSVFFADLYSWDGNETYFYQTNIKGKYRARQSQWNAMGTETSSK
ncbi:MAG: hypothetical protein M2R45_02744 [Verrucomicrobia subdivision 3 bacterium]|nr:hypothetical protein [Limisphaerales bacterium]MCS1414294.1 hypothetical protein [Limisphaerales bacterium]